MLEQIEMFEIPPHHYYTIPERPKKMGAWIVPYNKETVWSGAWYREEADAIKFSQYIQDRS